jgi:hypothetical protein
MAHEQRITIENVGDLPVPVSRGFPLIVRLSLLVGIALVFGVLGFTVGSSAFGHVWPWTEAMKIPL